MLAGDTAGSESRVEILPTEDSRSAEVRASMATCDFRNGLPAALTRLEDLLAAKG